MAPRAIAPIGSERLWQPRLFEHAVRRVTTDDPDRQRKAPPGDRAVPDLMTAFAGPDEGAADAHKQPAQFAIEGCGHSGRSDHRHRLDALGENVHLDLVARRGEP